MLVCPGSSPVLKGRPCDRKGNPVVGQSRCRQFQSLGRSPPFGQSAIQFGLGRLCREDPSAPARAKTAQGPCSRRQIRRKTVGGADMSTRSPPGASPQGPVRRGSCVVWIGSALIRRAISFDRARFQPSSSERTRVSCFTYGSIGLVCGLDRVWSRDLYRRKSTPFIFIV